MEFKNEIIAFYNSISTMNFNSFKDAREKAALLGKNLFSIKEFDLRGTENLPSESGIIFLYNHISNNPNYTFNDDFQITLDSHFISSMISQNYYQKPGVRVIRFSLDNEKTHSDYYNLFNYIRVYSKDFISSNVTQRDLDSSKNVFYNSCHSVLLKRGNLIINPEGKSSSTENSPSDFKAGIFKMIIRSRLDPIIVPLVMVNFDYLHSETTYRCEIKKPFRLSSKINDFENKKELNDFVISFQEEYSQWIDTLRKATSDYEAEIKLLIEKKNIHFQRKNLIVFYGSSTFRLWDKIENDFSPFNILNFGFGGAYIEDCLKYFDSLFFDLNPVGVVLYVGGNDFSLNYTPKKIFNLIKKLTLKFQKKLPQCKLFIVSIKPSYHRFEKMKQIMTLNQLIQNYFQKSDRIFYVNIFDLFFDHKKEIIKNYYLIDNLHLSREGYAVWKKEIYKSIVNEIKYF
jgi:lysophospholipase L1-like esterase